MKKWEGGREGGQDSPGRPEVDDDELVAAGDGLESLERVNNSNHGFDLFWVGNCAGAGEAGGASCYDGEKTKTQVDENAVSKGRERETVRVTGACFVRREADVCLRYAQGRGDVVSVRRVESAVGNRAAAFS